MEKEDFTCGNFSLYKNPTYIDLVTLKAKQSDCDMQRLSSFKTNLAPGGRTLAAMRYHRGCVQTK